MPINKEVNDFNMGPLILLKLAMNLFFLLALASCVGEVGNSAKKENEIESNYFIYSASSSVFEGSALELTILADKPHHKPRSIFWEIVDEWGQISTSYFLSDSGSLALLANEVDIVFNIEPLVDRVALSGKEFLVRIYIDNKIFVKKFVVKNLFSNDGGDSTVHTVSLTSFTNAGIVNEENQVLYSFGGSCSTPEGAILLTVTSGTNSVTKSEVCGAGNEWFSSMNLSSIEDGNLSVNVKHARGGITGEDDAIITKDATPPEITILSPLANVRVNKRNVTSFSLNGSCSENNREVVIQAFSANGNSSEERVLCLAMSWSAVMDLTSFNDEEIRIRVFHSDSVGNVSLVQRDFIKDTVAPLVSFTSPVQGSVYNSSQISSVSAAGTCNENGALVTLSGDVETQAMVCNNNIWFLSMVTLTEGDGPKIIIASISDNAGNVAYANLYVLRKTISPNVVLEQLPHSNDQMSKIRVGGQGVQEYSYKIGNDDILCEEEGYSAFHPVNVEIISDLGEDGDKKLCVVSRDEYGNTQELDLATSHTWVKDTTASLHISFTTPDENAIIDSSVLSIQGACSTDGVENITINLASESLLVDCALNLWSVDLDLSLVPDGVVLISAEHEGDTVTRKLHKYSTSPSLSFTLPLENSFIGKEARKNFFVSGDCNLYSEVPNVYITGGTSPVEVICDGLHWYALVDFPVDVDLDVTLIASITDEDDNEAIATRTFRLDTVDPLVSFTLPLEGSLISSANASSFLMSGTCSEDGIGNVEVFHHSTSLEVTDCELGNWTAIVDLSASLEGPVTIGVTHTDEALNKISSFRIFEKVAD